MARETRSIPYLVATFGEAKDERVPQEWQKAIATLCLVLVVAAREQEQSVQSAA